MCLTCGCQALHPCPPPPASIAAFCNCQGKRKEIESPSENTYHSSPGWREPGLLQKKKSVKWKGTHVYLRAHPSPEAGMLSPWQSCLCHFLQVLVNFLYLTEKEGDSKRGREERDGPKMSGSRYESWKWGPQISEGKTRILQTDHCNFYLLYFFQIQNHRKIGIIVSANLHMESGMVAHTCNVSTWEDEAGGLLRVWYQHELYTNL